MIVGISGKIGSGKDTIAGIIQRNSDEFWKIKKFADKLKQIATILTGVPIEKWEDQDFKKTKMPGIWGGMTYREFLQKLGTDAMRDRLHTDVWVNALFSEYVDPYANTMFAGQKMPLWIVTDVRFPNEAQRIIDLGGVLIRVERNTGYISDHFSETALDNWEEWHCVIDNNGSHEDLGATVYRVIDELCL